MGKKNMQEMTKVTKRDTPGAQQTESRARTYSPGLARWLTKVRMEEMLAGEHPYSYALNNPTTYVDPDGLQPKRQKQPWVPPDWPPSPLPPSFPPPGPLEEYIMCWFDRERNNCYRLCNEKHVKDFKRCGELYKQCIKQGKSADRCEREARQCLKDIAKANEDCKFDCIRQWGLPYVGGGTLQPPTKPSPYW